MIEGLQLPTGSLGDRVLRSRLYHRRGPIGRLLSWLRRARKFGQVVTSGPCGRFCAKGEDDGQHTLPSARPLPGPPLLPCHFPPRPRALQPSEVRVGRSRRKAARFRARCVAWDLLEMQLAVFNYFELGGPRDTKAIATGMGAWGLSSEQLASCDLLLRDDLALCRLHEGVCLPTCGRGLFSSTR